MLHESDLGMAVSVAPVRGGTLDPEARPIAAFIGRAPSGPLQRATLVTNIAHFERLFGAAWPPSTLGQTVRQFFEHGGEQALIVRVAANATGGELEIETTGAPLCLVATNPGSCERLRVSIDFDGVTTVNRFNLTVQRLDSQSRQIVDQELFRDVSASAGSERNLADRLEDSTLVRVSGPLPGARPLATPADFISGAIGYAELRNPGTDGDPLTDYDFIGAERHGTGLFALDAAERFDFLYACGEPGQPVTGAAYAVAAERYCAARNAMLVLDPPADCDDVATLLGWRQRRPHTSQHCLTYFPTVYHRDAPEAGECPAAGAIIGLLCRHDRREHVFRSLADDTRQNSAALHRDWQSHVSLLPEDALALLRSGVNPLIPGQQGRLLFPGLVTAANCQDRARGVLSHQRLIKFILGRIDLGTRWAVFETPGPDLWEAVRVQIAGLLEQLAGRGAFASSSVSAGWWVQCDAHSNAALRAPHERVRVLLGVQPLGAAYPIMFSITVHGDGTTAARALVQDRAPT